MRLESSVSARNIHCRVMDTQLRPQRPAVIHVSEAQPALTRRILACYRRKILRLLWILPSAHERTLERVPDSLSASK